MDSLSVFTDFMFVPLILDKTVHLMEKHKNRNFINSRSMHLSKEFFLFSFSINHRDIFFKRTSCIIHKTIIR